MDIYRNPGDNDNDNLRQNTYNDSCNYRLFADSAMFSNCTVRCSRYQLYELLIGNNKMNNLEHESSRISAVHLSKTSKLDGVKSWSLLAKKTCPGSKNASVCNGCYALGGFYNMPTVIQPRVENQKNWKLASWVDEMVAALKNERFFRWFDSGDIYKLELAEKILAVCERTPWVNHWIPTQSWDIEKFQPILRKIDALPNVVIRASAKHVDRPVDSFPNSSVVLSGHNKASELNVTICHSFNNAGKCGSCRACYDKTVKIIGYVQHGKTMAKHVNILLSTIKA